jgi:hypothetical protein
MPASLASATVNEDEPLRRGAEPARRTTGTPGGAVAAAASRRSSARSSTELQPPAPDWVIPRSVAHVPETQWSVP